MVIERYRPAERFQLYRHDVLMPDGQSTVLAYVGISNSAGTRTKQHPETKRYFESREVRITTVPFDPGTTRRQAEQIEQQLIGQLRPPFNNRHNPDYRKQGAMRARIIGEAPTVVQHVRDVRYRVDRLVARVFDAAVLLAVMLTLVLAAMTLT